MIRKFCFASLFVAFIAAPVASAQNQHTARLDAQQREARLDAQQREARLGAQQREARLGAQQREARLDANGNLDALIARHAAANHLPEDLVRRIIKRESGGNPRVVSSGNFGLMQIKLPTARAMGYTGTAAGLLDADTNMTYAVKYLAGAYHAADGNANRAVHYYAAGYYYAAKSKGLLNRASDNPISAFASASAAGETTGSIVAVKPAKVLRQARAEGVSSSSSLYSGRLDYH